MLPLYFVEKLFNLITIMFLNNYQIFVMYDIRICYRGKRDRSFSGTGSTVFPCQECMYSVVVYYFLEYGIMYFRIIPL